MAVERRNGKGRKNKRRKSRNAALFFLTLMVTLAAGTAMLMAAWVLLDGGLLRSRAEENGPGENGGKGWEAAAGENPGGGQSGNGQGEGSRGTESGKALGAVQSGLDTQEGGQNASFGTVPQDQAGEGTEGPAGKYAGLLADPVRMEAENTYPLSTASPDEVTLAFAGDILFDEGYAIMARMKARSGGDSSRYIEDAFDAPMLESMRGADLFMVNNEFTYTDRGAPTPGKTYTFRARPEYASLLHDMGADLVSLANNHAYDYGEVSLLDTMDTLKGVGIPYVGAGRDLAEAVRPVYFIAGDVKIAFLSATQIERVDNPDTKEATDTSPGVFRCRNVDRLLQAVAEAREQSDFVVVYVHWGTESTTELDWAQKEQAPKIAEAGADLIIGDHPHVLQGIDWIGDTPVIYSLGNYLFNSKTQDSCLVTVALDARTGKLKSFRFIPALQKNCRTTMHQGSEKERVLAHMRSLSPNAVIDAEGYVTPR